MDSLAGYDLLGFDSVLPPNTDPELLHRMRIAEESNPSMVYCVALSTWRTDFSNLDNLSMLCDNLDFSNVSTIVLKMRPESWESSHGTLGTILSGMGTSVETMIAIDWDIVALAAFLTTGDCEDATALGTEGNEGSQENLPFPNLRTLYVYGSRIENAEQAPEYSLTRAMLYRAKRGARIRRVCFKRYPIETISESLFMS